MLALSQLSYGPGSGGRLARVTPKREGHFSLSGWFFRVSFRPCHAGAERGETAPEWPG